MKSEIGAQGRTFVDFELWRQLLGHILCVQLRAKTDFQILRINLFNKYSSKSQSDHDPTENLAAKKRKCRQKKKSPKSNFTDG